MKGLRNQRGGVLCALHNRADAYPGEADKAAFKAHALIDEDKQAVCEFLNVPPGTYALSAIHDENNNKALDTNWIGIPKEGVGASRDAKGSFGPPKFDEAKIRYEGGALSLSLKMQYL